ncbi:MAG TPA: metallophosphoesterase [Bacteroidota bacterium]|nr:metallophosphoesterase [Bacteroidota bacterium]
MQLKYLSFAFLVCSGVIFGQEKITVALWGDSRENLDHACERIASVLKAQSAEWDVQVHTGDFTHHGSEEDWQRTMAIPGITDIYRAGKFLLCTSNHDAGQEGGKGETVRHTYDEHTKGILPVNDEDHTTHFYAWHKGNVHIVVLDPYFTDSTRMQRWLDRYLENVKPEEWLIGVWHNPAYSLTYKEDFLPRCRLWLESLRNHGGDFVFNGHAHMYVRTKPLSPEGIVDTLHGIVQVINGTGGASWKDPAPPDPRIAFTPTTRSFPVITYITFEGRTATLRSFDARAEHNLQEIDHYELTR